MVAAHGIDAERFERRADLLEQIVCMLAGLGSVRADGADDEADGHGLLLKRRID